MNVGIIGSGDVGRALGKGFVEHGHEVTLGTRDPGKDVLRRWQESLGSRVRLASFADAAAFGEIVVLATLWSGTENALRLAGSKNLAGKILIDTTNPLDFTTMPPALAVGHTDSGAEQVQRWEPAAKVVKAFNMVGNAHMIRPEFPGGPPDMFIAGNDAKAKETVTGLLRNFGWSVIDLGRIEASRYLEPLAMVWILHYFNTQDGNHAFKLLRK
jgi:predicted dinucleotide-binding enzyme